MIKTKEDCLAALEDITAFLVAKEPIFKAEYERRNNLMQRHLTKNGGPSAKNRSSRSYLENWSARNAYLRYIQRLDIAKNNAVDLHYYLQRRDF